MRNRNKAGSLSAHAIAGSYVVLLGLDIAKRDTAGLLGFAIERADPATGDRHWLRGLKVFAETGRDLPPGTSVSLRDHPLQSFQWGDYGVEPGRAYSYRVVALYGTPAALEARHEVTVAVTTEPVDESAHAVHFNRGVAGSQAYVREFGDREPRAGDRSDPAYTWLSRGLEEALLGFIATATGPDFALRGSVYEFNYPPVLAALKSAADRGVDVRIVYDRRGKAGTGERAKVWQASEPAIERAGLGPDMIPRRTNSAISHNKFLVLLRAGVPLAVWTGSANITWGGLFGQSNVGHLIRDTDVATRYLDYWTRLSADPAYARIRPANTAASPTPGTPPKPGIGTVFSPRTTLDMIDWYATQAGGARKSFFMTAAFGVHDKIAAAIRPESDVLRYLVLEQPPGKGDVRFDVDHDVKVAVGSLLAKGVLDRWVAEHLTNLDTHVHFTHTKFMLVDPLGDHPLVVSGSGNFSDPSVHENDENMLVIQDDPRVADIYLGEFMRIFNHFYFRFLSARKSAGSGFLSPDDSWAARYFDATTPSHRQRLLFR
ncbi:MAG TPA: phospholipase D-like domain-containing protein [Actinophytocola sp.]|jgi:phosphatidylserine/phosphatidylglycerophosphate/cardiolipin synthase-like enzyme|uniref:phospholipase D-like domain-containing protein n=1 Tax=Actinophytocola sp. TaxID=1872138 RepID=UPI002F93D65D